MKKALKLLLAMLVFMLPVRDLVSFVGAGFFKGEVSRASDNFVWIKTGQGKSVERGGVLYIRDVKTDEVKAIVKVDDILTRYVRGVIIARNDVEIEEGDKVNNVYSWDAYRYRIELNYVQGARRVVVVDDLVIDNRLNILGSDGAERVVEGGEVSVMEMGVEGGELGVKGLVLRGGEHLEVLGVDIKGLSVLGKKKVLYDARSQKVFSIEEVKGGTKGGGKGYSLFDIADLESIRVLEQLGGAKTYYRHRNLVPKQNRDGRYEVDLLFSDLREVINSLESRIKENEDEEVSKRLAQKILNKDSLGIEWIGVAGSFNGWDERKTLMRREGDVYKARVILEEGEYEYYYVMKLSGDENLLLGLLDNYTHGVRRIGDLDIKFLDEDEDVAEEEEKGGDRGDSKEWDDLDKDINPYEYVFGYEGYVSVLEVPGFYLADDISEESEVNKAEVSQKESDALSKGGEGGIEEKEDGLKRELSYNAQELLLEEQRLKDRHGGGSITQVEGENYYAVTFVFDRLNMVPIDIKQRINNEESKANPSYEEIERLKSFLLDYDENEVDGVTLVGSFGEHSMYSEVAGLWKAKLFLPSGRHSYTFKISQQDKEYELFNAFTEERGEDVEGRLINILDLD